MENSFDTSIIGSILVYLSSLNTFQLVFNMMSCSLSYWALLRSLFLFSDDSQVQFEPKSASSIVQGKKQGTRLDEEAEVGWSLLGKDVNMVMKALGVDKQGVLDGEGLQKRWGCDEISGAFEEEEVREEEVREAFNVFDQDKDGFVDEKELQRVLLALGLSQGVELKACKKMIRVFDKDGDGKIDFHEFVKLFHVE